jgi:hypothetical protein
MANEKEVFPSFNTTKFSNVHNFTISVGYDGITVWVSRYRDDGKPMKDRKILYAVRTDAYVELPHIFVDMHENGWFHYVGGTGEKGVFDIVVEPYLTDDRALKFTLKNFREF